jgi:hypothetical protein
VRDRSLGDVVRVAGHGLSVDAPAGWDARIFRRPGAAPVLHVATFALSERDGDYGAAATGRMRPDGAFAALVEFRTGETLVAGSGLFAAAGRPPPLRPSDLHARQLQVTRQGHVGCQRFFSERGRALCLYAVLWPVARALGTRLGELNGVLASLELDG